MTDNNRAVPNALPVGYRFNEFEIKKVIGGGGFGIVYQAWDHQLERTIAIKEFMPASLAVRGENMALVLRSERFSKAFSVGLNSFIQEARLLARFNHPNLLHVLRFWVQNDTAYMGTLFYSGTTLSRLREERPEIINETWIRHILPMLLGAIKTLHDEGYLHRDISLDNIQIQDNGLPILLDFGSARRTIGSLSDETETMLRPGFAPVEQYTDDNESEQGPWTDIYALGAVLHTLIVGSPPPVSVVRSIEDTCQPLVELRPQGYSLSLLNAIDRALALNIADRPQSIDQFAALIEMPVAGIEEVLVTKKPAKEPVPVAEKIVPSPDWRRYKIPAIIAAVLLVGITTGAILLSGGGHDTPAHIAGTPGATPPVEDATHAPEVAPLNDQTPPSDGENAPLSVAASPIAQVYIRMLDGETLTVNGELKTVHPASDGYAMLSLPVGEFTIDLQDNGKTRTQVLNITQPGTWLVNP
ncbi:serine/threonine-protein kinase [Enterobacteriaceae bacterium ESL0689]|nr:serine/threonine-protein kinase [Enterobacteriaceae bacterium ESL0689]